MNVSVVRVQTWPQAKELMAVRNSCRDGMTHHTAEITEDEQHRFWMDQLVADDPKYHAYLFMDGNRAFGFGVIKLETGTKRCWMTYGMVPGYRGRRLSRTMIQIITQLGYTEADEVWIDVWDDNFALRGDIREGYELQRSEWAPGNRILHVMKHRRNRQLGSAEANRLGEEPYDIATEMYEVDAIARASFNIA